MTRSASDTLPAPGFMSIYNNADNDNNHDSLREHEERLRRAREALSASATAALASRGGGDLMIDGGSSSFGASASPPSSPLFTSTAAATKTTATAPTSPVVMIGLSSSTSSDEGRRGGGGTGTDEDGATVTSGVSFRSASSRASSLGRSLLAKVTRVGGKGADGGGVVGVEKKKQKSNDGAKKSKSQTVAAEAKTSGRNEAMTTTTTSTKSPNSTKSPTATTSTKKKKKKNLTDSDQDKGVIEDGGKKTKAAEVVQKKKKKKTTAKNTPASTSSSSAARTSTEKRSNVSKKTKVRLQEKDTHRRVNASSLDADRTFSYTDEDIEEEDNRDVGRMRGRGDAGRWSRKDSVTDDDYEVNDVEGEYTDQGDCNTDSDGRYYSTDGTDGTDDESRLDPAYRRRFKSYDARRRDKEARRDRGSHSGGKSRGRAGGGGRRGFDDDYSYDDDRRKVSSKEAGLSALASPPDYRSTILGSGRRIRRYRGFSTSISSLFLDESLVCPSLSCFGLMLSQRTEHLLNERNRLRGVFNRGGKKGGERRPSHILSVALVTTVLFIGISYIVWGFGTDTKSAGIGGFHSDYKIDKEYEYYDDAPAKVYNDDGGNVNYDYNDDGGADVDDGNNDDGNDDGGNDDGANDDGGNDDGGNYAYQYNQAYYGDDYYQNGDDGNVAYAYDDDDDDDYYAGDDGRRWTRRRRAASAVSVSGQNTPFTPAWGLDSRRRGCVLGISKMADVYGLLWVPALEFLAVEMREEDKSFERGLLLSSSSSIQGDRGTLIHEMNESGGESQSIESGAELRRLEDYYSSGGNNDSGSSSSSGNPSDDWDVGDWIRLVLSMLFLLMLGVVGRRRRMRTRYALLRARGEDDELYYASISDGAGAAMAVSSTIDDGDRTDGGSTYLSGEGAFSDDCGTTAVAASSSLMEGSAREDQYEGACSHTLCGCYPVDPPHLSIVEEAEEEEEYEDGEDGEVKEARRWRKREDCLSRLLSCFLTMCCGSICRVWVQCFSACALAQEAREMRLLVPPRVQRVDWITHQAFHDYYRAIIELRLRWLDQKGRKSRKPLGLIRPHLNALSKLSRYIIMSFITVTVAIILTLRFNPRANFGWANCFVMIATFVQSFLVIFIVHWIFHKSDLSFDAVVKFFAAGFCIAMPTAFVCEIILINVILFTVYSVYAFMDFVIEDAFVEWVVDNYHIFWVIGELINSYIVASLTEELCKYYAFRCVEHPDLIFLTGLDRKSQDPDAMYGGIKNYSYASHNVSESRSYDLTEDDESIASWGSGRSRRRGGGALTKSFSAEAGESHFEEKLECRTIRQRAAAITTAMISCAVGLACAENFIYVFFFGGVEGSSSGGSGGGGGGGGSGRSSSYNSATSELGMLLLRSVFPVHALCAAMQSVGVIRKFLEDPTITTSRIGVGKIVLPAVLLHGTFDAILMCINVYIDAAWFKYEDHKYEYGEEDEEEEEGFTPYNAFMLDLIAWAGIVGTMLVSLLWYYFQNRNQKARLRIMEKRERLGPGRSENVIYEGPTMSSDTEGLQSDGQIV